jgi:hypothetical protein
MPFVPAPNIVEVQFRQSLEGSQTMNRIHINVLETPTSAIILSILGNLKSWWEDNVEDLVSSNLELREMYGKSLETQPGPEATFSSGLPLAGTITTEPLPANCSLAVSLRSGETGRSSRGRWFWQGFTESQASGSTVSGGVVASIDAAMTNLKSVIDGLGYVWVIVSYFHDNAPRVGGPVYFAVNDILIVDDVIDSQRRRLPGRGR